MWEVDITDVNVGSWHDGGMTREEIQRVRCTPRSFIITIQNVYICMYYFVFYCRILQQMPASKAQGSTNDDRWKCPFLPLEGSSLLTSSIMTSSKLASLTLNS
jgi:hypothetical protein